MAAGAPAAARRGAARLGFPRRGRSGEERRVFVGVCFSLYGSGRIEQTGRCGTADVGLVLGLLDGPGLGSN
jgi:hypothetical protein